MDTIDQETSTLLNRDSDATDGKRDEHRSQEAVEETARREEDQVRQMIQKLQMTREKISQDLNRSVPMLKELESELARLEDLCKIRQVLRLLDEIKRHDESMRHDLLQIKTGGAKQTESDLRLLGAVDHFEDLKATCLRVFRVAPAGNSLRDYSQQVLTHWNEELIQAVTPRFESVLQSSGWPVTGLDTLSGSTRLSTNSFDNFFVALLKLETRHLFETKSQVEEDNRIRVSLPLQIMIEPLKKRFYYHFVKSSSKTNQLEKPEWYLTQTLNWIRDHREYLKRNVDPILKIQSNQHKWPPAILQLTTGLLELIRCKLKNDLESDLIYDDRNFSHTFDEVYLFLKELETVLGFGTDHLLFIRQSGVDLFSLFTRDPFFTKLINLEKKRASEYVDSILESETAWSTLMSDDCDTGYSGSPDVNPYDEDENCPKVAEAADNFVILLQSIVERSSYCLTVNRRPFVELILEMLDDFRLRLSQLMRSASVGHSSLISSSSSSSADRPSADCEKRNCSKWPFSQMYFGILNTLSYLLELLDEWKMHPYFSDSSLGLFDETSSLLKHMLLEMQKRIVDSFLNQLRLKLYVYSNQIKWFCLTPNDEKAQIATCHVFHFLSTSLDLLKRQLSSRVFDSVAVTIASETSGLFLEDVILRNSFNSDGAAKIRSDVRNHLMTIFQSFIRRPEPFLSKISEAVTLLSLQKGASLLLEEAINTHLKNCHEYHQLDHDHHDVSCNSPLADFNIDSLSLKMSKTILQKRIHM